MKYFVQLLMLLLCIPTAYASKNPESIYLKFKNKSQIFMAGFNIDSRGENQPVVIFRDRMKKQQWIFDTIVADIFLYEQQVHLVLDNGKTYMFTGEQWVIRDWMLPEKSSIVFSEGKQVIACTADSLFKHDTTIGRCYSYRPDWQAQLSWKNIKPVVCNGVLFSMADKTKQITMLDIQSGQLMLPTNQTNKICDTKKLFRNVR